MKQYLIQTLLGSAGRILSLIFSILVEKHVFNEALALAETQVARLAGDTSLDNAAKRQAAIDGLRTDLAAAGLELRDALLSLAVEMAVAALKAQVQGK